MINLHISFLFTSCFFEAFGVHCQGLGLGNFQLLSVQFLFVLTPWKVVFTLVSAMFSQPNLSWTPLDHVESFAGDLSVTLGEWEVWGSTKSLNVF